MQPSSGNQADGYAVRSVQEDSALSGRIDSLIGSVWPPFVVDGHTPRNHPFPPDWPGIFKRWPQHQYGLLDRNTDELAGAANALPFAWDGAEAELPDGGWDWAMWQGKQDYLAGNRPRTMCALSITVAPAYRDHGLASLLVSILRRATKEAGFTRLLAPVRPTLKHRYPITPMADYMRWQNDRGEPFDPWVRIHTRLDAAVVRPCEQSMSLAGSVAEWESWTGLQFPASARFVAPSLLAPLLIDREMDQGLYVEPNIWMVHNVSA